MKRPCLEPGCHNLTQRTRCLLHQRQYDASRRPSSHERYGPGWDTTRRGVLERDGWVCQVRLPGCRIEATTVDHIVRREDGGPHTEDNLRAACGYCNSARR